MKRLKHCWPSGFWDFLDQDLMRHNIMQIETETVYCKVFKDLGVRTCVTRFHACFKPTHISHSPSKLQSYMIQQINSAFKCILQGQGTPQNIKISLWQLFSRHSQPLGRNVNKGIPNCRTCAVGPSPVWLLHCTSTQDLARNPGPGSCWAPFHQQGLPCPWPLCRPLALVPFSFPFYCGNGQHAGVTGSFRYLCIHGSWGRCRDKRLS